MRRFLLSQLRHRRARSAALGGGILVAAVGFVLLASAARTTDVRVQGSVESNFRAAYDILVRPRGSFTELERRERLVRPNYLSGIYGGISLDQYERIKRIRGVDVAAPIANVGFVIPSGIVPVPIDGLLDDDFFQIYRVRFSWHAHQGLSQYRDDSGYVYYSHNRFKPWFGFDAGGELVAGSGEPLEVCSWLAKTAPYAYGPFASTGAFMSCYSARTRAWNVDQWPHVNGALLPDQVGTATQIWFPIFVAAIDPEQEARLLALDRSIVAGRYLREGDRPTVEVRTPKLHAGVPKRFGEPSGRRLIPVIVSSRGYADEVLRAQIERLQIPAAVDVPRTLASRGVYPLLTRAPGRVLDTRAYKPDALYSQRLEGSVYSPGTELEQRSEDQLNTPGYWTTSPTRYRSLGPDLLAAVPTQNPIDVWRSPGAGGSGFLSPPPSNQDLQFRKLGNHPGSNIFGADRIYRTPSFKVVGRFDPEKLPGFSALSEVPLETYYPPLVEPGDEASERALGGKALLPTQNLGDYIQQPPLVLTTLEGAQPFFNPVWFGKTKGMAAAPISVIRVRVAGVTGPDELSVERIRRVAIAIRDRTGLDVDITAGSSPHPLNVRLPAGKFGRPALTVREGWSKKGVAVSFLRALDDKRLALLSLVLVACAFFVANGAFAATRTRRTEIGTLLCLGWGPGSIFAAVLGELALIGVAAGLVGAVVAAGLAAALSLDVPLERSLLVAPVSLLLAVVAGLVPAWRAAQSVPLDAVRPPITRRRRVQRVRHLSGLALANVRRVPGRSLVAVAGLFVGVAALTLIVAVNAAFQGTLVGTLLGDAISIQVRGLDYLTVGLIIALSAMAVADVLFLNLRERAAELVTLRTLGWRDRDLATVAALEAVWLGAIGGVGGALLGGALGALLGVPAGPLALGAAGGAAGGVAVSLLASVIPASRISSLAPPRILAEE